VCKGWVTQGTALLATKRLRAVEMGQRRQQQQFACVYKEEYDKLKRRGEESKNEERKKREAK